MKTVLVTQRVDVDPHTGERRDAVDQAWHRFLSECGLQAVLVANHLASARRTRAAHRGAGLLLTGGNSLTEHGGDAPERDAIEAELVEAAFEEATPVLGVCRGMQLLLHRGGAKHERVEGHVRPIQEVQVHGEPAWVNSYHDWGCREAPPEYEVWARAEDGVVKAVRHRELPVIGLMWHPERLEPFRSEDRELFRTLFEGGAP